MGIVHLDVLSKNSDLYFTLHSWQVDNSAIKGSSLWG